MSSSTGRAMVAAAVVLSAAMAPPQSGPEQANQPVAAASLEQAIAGLGALEFAARTSAARTVRRAPATLAVPALQQAALGHEDGYVRYRALVLLSGFSEAATRSVTSRVIADPNDRIREVAYRFVEHHPDPALAPTLMQALEKEESEFVRPALIRALAALGTVPKVRETLLVEVDRGVDFFRSVVIEALGDYTADYAVPSLLRIVRLDGPLQDDAAIALGKTGDRRALEVFSALQRTAPRNVQPSIAAAICLLGVNCPTHQRFLEDTLRFAVDQIGFQELVRSAAGGLAALTARGNAKALATLLDVGIPSQDPARAAIALAVGGVALRNPALLVSTLEAHPDAPGAALLLRDAFDMLEEDFEEERFFAATRGMYWQAPEGSATRRVGDLLIRTLEF